MHKSAENRSVFTVLIILFIGYMY